jgi:hypothetical protein
MNIPLTLDDMIDIVKIHLEIERQIIIFRHNQNIGIEN